MAEAPFPVEYAALGLLARGPRHGYELKKEIEQKLRPIWHIATSRLYLALSRLEEKGFIKGEPQSSRGRARRVYRLTPAGHKKLREWLTSPVPSLRDLRVEFLAKLFFLFELSPGDVPALIQAEIRTLRALRKRLLEEASGSDHPIWELIRDFRLGQIEAALEWLQRVAARFPEEVRE